LLALAGYNAVAWQRCQDIAVGLVVVGDEDARRRGSLQFCAPGRIKPLYSRRLGFRGDLMKVSD
jgi:hypothetical protein